MMSLTVAEINLNNLIHNLNQVRSCIESGCRILAVVKANAYGHGLLRISQELEQNGVDMLGVAHVEEGICLREGGIRSDILVMGVLDDSQAGSIVEWRLTPVIYTLSVAKALSLEASRRNTTISVHIKVDTGMRRIGLDPSEVVKFVREISGLKGIRIEGIMTHFAEADLANIDFVREQLYSFISTWRTLERDGIHIPLKHAANSAAIIELKESHLDIVRPGIMLYGYIPSHSLAEKVDVRPVLNLKTKVVYVKRVPPKTGISYGRTFVTSRETLVATIAIGYGDGYNRLLSNRGEVLVRGNRAPVIGRVCMDMSMVDVTGVPGVSAGDEVVLIGTQGREQITADDIARWTETISYEVLCNIGERVERKYISGRR